MNSHLLVPYKLISNIKKINRLPDNEDKKKIFFEKLYLVTNYCLIKNSNEISNKILNNYYLCPIQFIIRYPEKNIEKLSSVIIESIKEPNFVKNFRFAHKMSEQEISSIYYLCQKVLPSFFDISFKRINDQWLLDFRSNL